VRNPFRPIAKARGSASHASANVGRSSSAVIDAQTPVELITAQWTTTVQSARQSLGRPSSRTLHGAVQSKTSPSAPAGDYRIPHGRTLANRSDAIETVMTSGEPAGLRVGG
jgi:hypothetical protein